MHPFPPEVLVEVGLPLVVLPAVQRRLLKLPRRKSVRFPPVYACAVSLSHFVSTNTAFYAAEEESDEDMGLDLFG